MNECNFWGQPRIYFPCGCNVKSKYGENLGSVQIAGSFYLRREAADSTSIPYPPHILHFKSHLKCICLDFEIYLSKL